MTNTTVNNGDTFGVARAKINQADAVRRFIAYGAIDRGLNTPPGSPTDGDVYIVGTSPTGAWAGQPNKIAVRHNGAWIFEPSVNPAGSNVAIGAAHEGLSVYVRDENATFVWSGTEWVMWGGLFSVARSAVRVEDYLSVGQTATQRREAFQAAINDGASQGRPVLIPPGTWDLDDERLDLLSGVHIEATRGYATLRCFNDRAVSKPVIEAAGANTIYGLHIWTEFSGAPAVSDTNAGLVMRGLGTVVEDVTITGRFYVGANARGAKRLWWDRGVIRGSRNRGMYLYEDCQDVRIRGLHVNCLDVGTSTPYTYYGVNTNPGGTLIAENLSIRDVTVRDYLFHAIALSERCGPSEISGCFAKTSAAGAVGIILQAANGQLLRGARVVNNTVTGGQYGFYVQGSLFYLMAANACNAQAGTGSVGFLFVDSNYGASVAFSSDQTETQGGVQIVGTAAAEMRRMMLAGGVTFGGAAGANQGVWITGGAANASQDVVISAVGSYGHNYGLLADVNTNRLAIAGYSARGNGAANTDTTAATQVVTAAINNT